MNAWRFGLYELDGGSGELRKEGRLIKLQDQPMQVLRLLVERAGEIVTREEIQQAVWPGDTFVDFDHGVNTAVKKVRLALGDAADNPRFIETLPRKGYRFIAPVTQSTSLEPERLEPEPEPAAKFRWNIPAIAVLAMVAVGAAWWLYSKQQPAAAPAFTPEALTSYIGNESDPNLSPDGRLVAFTWSGPSGDNIDIYIKQIGVEEPRRLTTDPEQEYAPTFSPDGQRIAFLRAAAEGRVGVWIIPAAGGPEVNVSEVDLDPALSNSPYISWRPDGNAVLVTVKKNPEGIGIWQIPVAGGEGSWLLVPRVPSHGYSGASFSPDGRWLVFMEFLNGSNEILVQRMSPTFQPEGAPRQLTNLHMYQQNATWMPDGQSIIFSTNPNDHLWMVPISGGPPRRLDSLGDHVDLPTTSRSGMLAYRRGRRVGSIWSADIGDGTLQPIITSTSQNLNPRYSPDGRRIVFISARSGSTEVWLANADGSSPTQMTHMKANVTGWPSWSTDGSRILFDSNLSGNYRVYTMSAAGGEPVLLKTGTEAGGVAGWSRDGASIYFAAGTNFGSNEIWKVPATGGQAHQVTKSGGRLALESPDGRFYYYAKDGNFRSDLWRVPVAGGEEIMVLPNIRPLTFHPVNDGVYYVPPGELPNGFDIRFHSWSTGNDRLVVNVPNGQSRVGLTLSPDGSTLLFAKSEQAESDLMMAQISK